ncbi:ethanolamine ammonia-lyase reactivating factor EutA [Micromonospora sp. NPDC023966]|uniref:ethanolamine ammonia-lyase reactivating factor EutA n=1 Tax=Micromonospora sp. NPDC023966 TaxID=3154699 RepID=UPI0033E4C8E7
MSIWVGHGHHDRDDDHDHHDGEPDSNVMWVQDNVVLHSVGVDIGSATTQIAFSRLHLRRHAADLTSRYIVVRRELVHDGGTRLTPYADGNLIDAVALGTMLDEAYASSGWTADDIDTGAVILTGEALRRANAELIGKVVAQRAGQLVCATAGHHMEALLAAYGSGTVRRSHDEASVLLNVDIGGGTTKLTLVERGRVVGTAAFLVGGRLAVVDDGVLVRLEPGGARHAAAAGFTWELGGAVSPAELVHVGEVMAKAVADAIAGKPDLYLTDLLPLPDAVDGVVVSGGVSAYLHGRETQSYGDLGPALADGLRRRFSEGSLPGPLLAGEEAIRATVVGASEHTVQLSGITGHLSDPEASLPRRDLPVAHLDDAVGDEVDEVAVADGVRGAFAGRDIGPDQEAVLAVTWGAGAPRYPRVAALARGLVAGLGDRAAAGRTVYLMLDGDVAMTLGRILTEELGVEAALVVLDGIQLREFDHVDLGRVRPISGNVPITIKSLAFTHGRD